MPRHVIGHDILFFKIALNKNKGFRGGIPDTDIERESERVRERERTIQAFTHIHAMKKGVNNRSRFEEDDSASMDGGTKNKNKNTIDALTSMHVY